MLVCPQENDFKPGVRLLGGDIVVVVVVEVLVVVVVVVLKQHLQS